MKLPLLVAILAIGAHAADTNPSFEVATIKPSAAESTTRRFSIQGQQFLTFNTTLADLIQFAYGLHPRQVAGGPGWIESSKFDVVGLAKGDREPTEPEWMKMMANLVTERFQLHYRIEKRELPVYAITVEKDVPKLEPGNEGPNTLPAFSFRGRGEMVARNASMADFAWELQSAVLNRPVVDHSGLMKRFNFTLSWTPDEFQSSALAGDDRTADQIAPNLFTAMRQQLGLRLTATRSNSDIMQIEHVELPEHN